MKIRIVKCREPDDMNFGGWDMLAERADGSYSCFAEVRDFDLVLAFLNGTAPTLQMESVRSNLTMVRS
ncbi:MAG TPA: hypothetical protein VNC22_23330 [Sporichthya sp.]|jgi:hypothetical protein|nr:hypothetical protein [Sporichthya sp.]